MSTICPTVLARTTEEYEEQIRTVETFADRIQVDLGDGVFTSETVAVTDAWWPASLSVDVHCMYQRPAVCLDHLISLAPSLIILHAEAEGNIQHMLARIKEHGIAAGVAVLQETNIGDVSDVIRLADHALIFSGSLGSFGGVADLGLLRKVPEIHRINPDIEIGWDGGVNRDTAIALVKGGIDVLNVGGAIQKASHPENAYRELVRLMVG